MVLPSSVKHNALPIKMSGRMMTTNQPIVEMGDTVKASKLPTCND
jgi:hypothetical protein